MPLITERLNAVFRFSFGQIATCAYVIIRLVVGPVDDVQFLGCEMATEEELPDAAVARVHCMPR